MSTEPRVPAGAFSDAARILDAVADAALGEKDRKAPTAQARALAEMREAVNEHDVDIAGLLQFKEEMLARPF